MRTFICTVALLALLQWLLPYAVPVEAVYHNRMIIDYDRVLTNPRDIDVAIEQVKKDVAKRHLDKYAIILGDSVPYGSPGNSEQTVNAFMMQQNPSASAGDAPSVIYNLSFPSMQTGDVYTMVLKLQRAGLSTDHLIMNVRYASFVPRDPYPRVVFYLYDELRKLDREAYDRVHGMLEETEGVPPKGLFAGYKYVMRREWLPSFKVYNYKDYLYDLSDRKWRLLNGRPIPDDIVKGGDPRPYYEKDLNDLAAYLESDEIANAYTDTPFDMTEANPDIYFWNKIIARLNGKQPLILFSGTNHTLMKRYMEKPGYQANQERIDAFFRAKPVHYVNLEGVVPDNEFVDHTHLTAEGNKRLAGVLLTLLEERGG